ncbi:MAG: histidine--tRNA ligase [Bacteroidetes bacterium]|nr:histidine--tRNA ligase [Bacteroidota bacterium]
MKPSTPKGTRDFSPTEMVRRNFIFKTIREVFEKYGYQPIETPAMENLETLTGKYGDEGDKLIFKILDSGEYFESVRKDLKEDLQSKKTSLLNLEDENFNKQTLQEQWECIEKIITDIKTQDVTKHISEKALRYDLTVPFARYVVQHQNEITFPFKRYQIQPVWRADRPQRGRYREFYQCDADVIGSDSLLNEVELIQIINDVYTKLGISVTIKINNRKILQGIADFFKIKDFSEFVTILDKADKMGAEFVRKELISQNILPLPEAGMFSTLFFESPQKELKAAIDQNKLNLLKVWNEDANSEIGKKGVEEIEFIFSQLSNIQYPTSNIQLDISLARGLNYYTGAIFEVKANDLQMGSICGGGRYDDLTGIFGLPNISGVGISFGIDRIFDVMNELNLFDSIGLTASITKVMLAHFGEAERTYCIGVASQLRVSGINTEVYPDITKKISKQFGYANKKQIPFVIVIGGDEMKTGELTLKNMISGEQIKMKVDLIISKLI